LLDDGASRCPRCGLEAPRAAATAAVRGWSLSRAALRGRPAGLGPPRVEVTLLEGEPDAPTMLLRLSAQGFGWLVTRQYVAPRAGVRRGVRGWWERRVDAFRAWRVIGVLGRRSVLLRVAARLASCRVTAVGLARFAQHELVFADGVQGWIAGAARPRTPALAPRTLALAPTRAPSSKRVSLLLQPPRLGAVPPFSRALLASRPSLLTVLVPSTVDGPLLRARDPQESA
jgi:hypothetical protein